MKTPLSAGALTGSREFTVDRERTIDFMGEDARVYATPMLVRDIEITCRDLLRGQLEPGEDSVGTRVEIDHLAPTLLGMKVRISAKAVEIKGRAVVFEVEARDDKETVGVGRHARFVVDVNKTKERLKAKQAA
jgi:predicted thioesterase